MSPADYAMRSLDRRGIYTSARYPVDNGPIGT